MRISVVALALLAVARLSAFSYTNEADEKCPCVERGPFSSFSVEGRMSGLFFVGDLMNDIYGAGVNGEIMGSVPLGWGFELWGAVDYFAKKGHTDIDNTATRITLVPLTIGPRYTYQFGHFLPYIGAGLKYYFLHIHNYSSYVIKEISKNAPGVVGEVGCKYLIWDHLIVDGFFNYSYVHFSAPHTSLGNVVTTHLNLQCWNLGLGIGYEY